MNFRISMMESASDAVVVSHEDKDCEIILQGEEDSSVQSNMNLPEISQKFS